MWVAMCRVAWEHGDVDEPPRSTCSGPATWAKQRAWHSSPTGGGSRWPSSGRAKVTWRPPTRCSPRPTACSTATSRPTFALSPRSAPECTSGPATSTLPTAGRQLVGVTAADELTYLREYEHTTLARLLMADHEATGDRAKLGQAVGLLTRLHDAAAEAGRTAAVVETDLLLVAARDIAGGHD